MAEAFRFRLCECVCVCLCVCVCVCVNRIDYDSHDDLFPKCVFSFHFAAMQGSKNYFSEAAKSVKESKNQSYNKIIEEINEIRMEKGTSYPKKLPRNSELRQ